LTSGAVTTKSVLFILLAALSPFAAFGQAVTTVTFADGLKYNDFYAVSIEFQDEEPFTIFDAASLEGEVPPWPGQEGAFGALPGSNPGKDMKYFFWIRRLGTTGAITYPLAFSKIASIEFLGAYGGTLSDPPQDARLVIGEDKQEVKVLIRGSRFSGWIGLKEPPVPSFTPAKLTLTDGSVQDVQVKSDGFLGGIDEEFGTYALLWLAHDGISKLVFNHSGTFARCPECGAIYYDGRNPVCRFDGAQLTPPRQR
jgi:hypothetical protein